MTLSLSEFHYKPIICSKLVLSWKFSVSKCLNVDLIELCLHPFPRLVLLLSTLQRLTFDIKSFQQQVQRFPFLCSVCLSSSRAWSSANFLEAFMASAFSCFIFFRLSLTFVCWRRSFDAFSWNFTLWIFKVNSSTNKLLPRRLLLKCSNSLSLYSEFSMLRKCR